MKDESFARHRRWWGVAGIGTGHPVLGDSSWAVKRVPTKAPVPTAGTQFLEAKAEGATGPDLGLAYLSPRGSRGTLAGLSTGTAGSMGPWPPQVSGTPLPEEKAGLKGVGLEGGCYQPPCPRVGPLPAGPGGRGVFAWVTTGSPGPCQSSFSPFPIFYFRPKSGPKVGVESRRENQLQGVVEDGEGWRALE